MPASLCNGCSQPLLVIVACVTITVVVTVVVVGGVAVVVVGGGVTLRLLLPVVSLVNSLVALAVPVGVALSVAAAVVARGLFSRHNVVWLQVSLHKALTCRLLLASNPLLHVTS